ncbi:MAG TPA: 2-oxoglutarate dehydrogenase, E2 component, dihydrolipoamide succinyltransferase [Blastocatellia bacterium]|nr:2-oxoglutarate dehydrogenase, E2 component, dihydrolipoamide succinyltransferase [Blastocatellia bacterium]
MAEEVKMPQMGESIAEGTIVKWLKQVGEAVKRDEPLFEISTDKVDAEIPAPASGVLSEIRVKEGETVAVNTVVAVINGAGAQPVAAPPKPEAAPAPPAEQAAAPPEPAAETQAEAAPRESQPQAAAPTAEPAPAAPPSEEELRRVRSSPVVRKIAQEQGVDISQIQGTGISGRVTKNDILSYIENRGAASAAPQAPAAQPVTAAPPQAPRAPQPLSVPAAAPTEVGPPPYSEGDRVQIEPMTIMRRKIAERMIESHRVSAHVYSVIEVDYTETARLRDRLKGEYLERDGVKLTFLPFIIKAVIEGIKKWPIINSSVWGDQVVYKQDINVGVAVALDWGLIVPVIRNADEKSLLGLARAVNDLGDRARNKKLKPDEVQGGTFTITNPGVFGGLMGLPIINQPQVAILGVGGIKKRPVVINDAIAIRQTGLLTLSYDHRIIDGAVAEQFLAILRDVIESGEYNS